MNYKEDAINDKNENAITFPKIFQSGQVFDFPDWAKYLAKLGWYMTHSNSSIAYEIPRIALISLPRIDYAALFLAYGSLCSVSNNENTDLVSTKYNIDSLITKTVCYLKIKGNEHSIILGVLESIDHTAGIATLVTKISNSSYYRFNIDRKDWHLIRQTDIKFNILKGASESQRRHAGELYRDYNAIAKVVGKSIASEITKTSTEFLAIFGEKNRFYDEISSLDFKNDTASISAGILLNPKDLSGDYNFRSSGRYVNFLASGQELSATTTHISIIEAGRRLGDQLPHIRKDKRAIILIAANKRSHNDLVELLAPLINFSGILKTTPNLGPTPYFIKSIFIE